MSQRSFIFVMVLSGLSLVTNCYGVDVPPGCVRLEGRALQNAQKVFTQKVSAYNSMKNSLVKNLTPEQKRSVSVLVTSFILDLQDNIRLQRLNLESGIACNTLPDTDAVIQRIKDAIIKAGVKDKSIVSEPNCVYLEGKALQDATDLFSQQMDRYDDMQKSLVKNLTRDQMISVNAKFRPAYDAVEAKITQQRNDFGSGKSCKFPYFNYGIQQLKNAITSAGVREANAAAPSQQPMELFRAAVKDPTPNRFVSLIQQFRPRQLYLNSLGLKTLPAWFSQVNLTEIETLDLSSNGLEKLEGLEGMKNLKNLNVGQNALVSFEGIQGLAKLEGLYAPNNSLGSRYNGSAIPQFLPKNLQELVLDGNGITGMMPRLDSPNLKRIAVSRNPALTMVCSKRYNAEGTFTYDTVINPEELLQLELAELNYLDDESKECLKALIGKRAAANKPLRVIGNLVISNRN